MMEFLFKLTFQSFAKTIFSLLLLSTFTINLSYAQETDSSKKNFHFTKTLPNGEPIKLMIAPMNFSQAVEAMKDINSKPNYKSQHIFSLPIEDLSKKEIEKIKHLNHTFDLDIRIIPLETLQTIKQKSYELLEFKGTPEEKQQVLESFQKEKAENMKPMEGLDFIKPSVFDGFFVTIFFGYTAVSWYIKAGSMAIDPVSTASLVLYNWALIYGFSYHRADFALLKSLTEKSKRILLRHGLWKIANTKGLLTTVTKVFPQIIETFLFTSIFTGLIYWGTGETLFTEAFLKDVSLRTLKMTVLSIGWSTLFQRWSYDEKSNPLRNVADVTFLQQTNKVLKSILFFFINSEAPIDISKNAFELLSEDFFRKPPLYIYGLAGYSLLAFEKQYKWLFRKLKLRDATFNFTTKSADKFEGFLNKLSFSKIKKNIFPIKITSSRNRCETALLSF